MSTHHSTKRKWWKHGCSAATNRYECYFCFIDGCGLFVGDVHYAQGDGEVSGTAIEMGSVTTLRVVKIHPGKAKDLSMPATKGNDQIIDMEPTRITKLWVSH